MCCKCAVLQVSAVLLCTGRLLDSLLRRFPGLKWCPALLRALYMGLSHGAEEEDAGEVPPGMAAARRADTQQRLKWVSSSAIPLGNMHAITDNYYWLSACWQTLGTVH
jgi:hypothetical protein